MLTAPRYQLWSRLQKDSHNFCGISVVIVFSLIVCRVFGFRIAAFQLQRGWRMPAGRVAAFQFLYLLSQVEGKIHGSGHELSLLAVFMSPVILLIPLRPDSWRM